MALADKSGAGGGDQARALDILRGEGISSPSSGLINFVRTGASEYGPDEAQRYGLPLTSRLTTEMRNTAIAPAVASYQASKPEIGVAFDTRTSQLTAEKQPLMDRYQNLLTDLTGRENKDVTAQGQALSSVYGQRGIDLSSGAYQQDLAKKNQSITDAYGVQRKDVGLSQESDLRDLSNQISNLTTQRVTAMREIDNKIAELQAGAGNQAATDALANYRATLDQKFASRFDDLDRQIKEKSLQPAAPEYKTIEFGNNLYGFNPADMSIQQLAAKAGGNTGLSSTPTPTPSTPKPTQTWQEMVKYAAGRKAFGL